VTLVTSYFDMRSGLSSGSISIDVAYPSPGQVCLTVSGEVDLASSGHLDEAVRRVLDEHRPAGVELELSGVNLLDSTGVRSLLLAQSAAEAAGCRLAVTNPQPRVHRVLAITAVLERLGLPPEP
jgi:anti-sigma B factor antagonist